MSVRECVSITTAASAIASGGPDDYLYSTEPGFMGMPAMRLLPRWRRDWAEDSALQQRIGALQAALDSCKGVARRWSEFRRGVTAAIAALALAAGFALGVYREPLAQAAVDLAAALGLAAPAVDPATAAYRSGDDAAALQLARPRAEQGDPRAQALLGLIYSRRRGALQDDTEAVRWLRLAADQGDASALFNLGLMSEEGRGVPQDYAEAAKWYRLAAEQGYPPGPIQPWALVCPGRGRAAGQCQRPYVVQSCRRALPGIRHPQSRRRRQEPRRGGG